MHHVENHVVFRAIYLHNIFGSIQKGTNLVPDQFIFALQILSYKIVVKSRRMWGFVVSYEGYI